jgi:ribosomal protein S24E
VPELQLVRKSESKLLGRTYVEYLIETAGGKLARKDAIALLSKEMGVPSENVGLLELRGQSGATNVVGRFLVYDSQEWKKQTFPKHLEARLLSKEEREKLKQAKKKKSEPAKAEEKK